MSLKDKRLFLLDMDGTIYIDETLFDGTTDFLDYVKKIGGKYVFLTNNSSRGTDAYIAKMARLGIEAFPGDFLTSADAAVDYLLENGKDDLYYVCGTESLKKQLREGGLRVAETFDPAADAVLLGYDTELTYEKLENCCRLLNRGCRYYATHPDKVCPVSYGFAPDCGSVIDMLQTATGRVPFIIGKPKPQMAFAAMKRFGYSPQQTCIMGDRLHTDIACGLNAGIDAIFVLSGEHRESDIARLNIHPTYIFENIREVLQSIGG